MKYKITIEKIEKTMVSENNYVEVDPYTDHEGKTRNHDYRREEKEEEVSEIIYTQKTNQAIDLKGIIDAFNNTFENQEISKEVMEKIK